MRGLLLIRVVKFEVTDAIFSTQWVSNSICGYFFFETGLHGRSCIVILRSGLRSFCLLLNGIRYLDDEAFDFIDVGRTVVSHVRFSLVVQNNQWNIFDGCDGIARHFNDFAISTDIDDSKLTPLNGFWKSFENGHQFMAVYTLRGIKQK